MMMTEAAEFLKAAEQNLTEEIKRLYLERQVPWVIGYSGGKDSTVIVQLVWNALKELPNEQRQYPVYVITTDTLVENPIVAAWVTGSLKAMGEAARNEGLPIEPHLLEPDTSQTFWVNLIGRGYPAPRHGFRWCTERLKIKPSTRFIQETISASGEVVLVLGVRKAESATRSGNISRRQAEHGHRLRPHDDMPGCQTYTPIEEWGNADVWKYLHQVKNPWGVSNKDLQAMYAGATEDNECPVVVDTTTPSCGSSRFGCWVCTLVEEDKSMGAMINNDHEKEWMLPLLELRNELDFRNPSARANDRARRDFRRMGGRLQFYNRKSSTDSDSSEQRLIPGPYTQAAREEWLRKLLTVQQVIRNNPESPSHVKEIELVTLKELEEIRRIWVVEKHEIEDLVPQIYSEVVEEPYPGQSIDHDLVFNAEALAILRDVCDDDPLSYEMLRDLLDIERRYSTKAKRRGIFNDLERVIQRCYYENEEDALTFHKERMTEPEPLSKTVTQ
jgi:DNA sulfur modification protein DndC